MARVPVLALAVLLTALSCGSENAGPGGDGPPNCTPTTAARTVATFLDLAATNPQTAEGRIAFGELFEFYSVNDPDAARLGDEARDRSSVRSWLVGRAAADERFEIRSLIVVGEHNGPGFLVNMNLDRYIGDAGPVNVNGPAQVLCPNLRLSRVSLVTSDAEPVPLTAKEECDILFADVVEGFDFTVCWLPNYAGVGES